ncbi:MAG: ATP-binding cassette domain-containing protein [Synergistaceae bacterium]|jgi:oligopeptide transport system ATP-binding protein|nr:ATP-binding cassette domain-containing protein [Synergistaceae bacterium]
MPMPLLDVRNLKKYFPLKRGLFGSRANFVKAVDDVSLSIERGETLGLVGESGCGKTTVGRTIARLYDPSEGSIRYDGTDISHMTQRELVPFRRKIQMIFQDPFSSLDPRMTVGDIVGEAIDIHGLATGQERAERIRSILSSVGLSDWHANRYPHEFSGGQRQRIGIARALVVEPSFIVCDEPISALDVSIQAQIVNMLEDFQEKFGLTYLFIAHDLSMVKHISTRIGVMYLGSLVELAGSNDLYETPLHPYTKSLLSAIPIPDPIEAANSRRIMLEGEVPSPIDTPPWCKFVSRCPQARSICGEDPPEFREVASGHFAACHFI